MYAVHDLVTQELTVFSCKGKRERDEGGNLLAHCVMIDLRKVTYDFEVFRLGPPYDVQAFLDISAITVLDRLS